MVNKREVSDVVVGGDEFRRHIDALFVPEIDNGEHGFFVLFERDFVEWRFGSEECVDMDGLGILQFRQIFQKLEDSFLRKAGFELLRVGDEIALFAAPDAAFTETAVGVLDDGVLFKIFRPVRAVFIGVVHVDVETDIRVVFFPRLAHHRAKRFTRVVREGGTALWSDFAP